MIRVVAGVIHYRGRVLTAWRGQDQHAGGCWEFPGGKVHSGESPSTALQRELYEEIGVQTSPGLPVICLRYDYPDRQIKLNVRETVVPVQTIYAQQGQFLRWCPTEKLQAEDFPPANNAVISALKLPHTYAITPLLSDAESAVRSVCRLLDRSSVKVHLILLRLQNPIHYVTVVKRVLPIVKATGTQLMLHDAPEDVMEQFGNQIAGIHLSQSAFREIQQRPVMRHQWFAVSCHSLTEIEQATANGADFCVLGHVRDTPSHKDQPALGTDTLAQIVAAANIPVFALGGMQLSDIEDVRGCGGQGIAGIRCFQDV